MAMGDDCGVGRVVDDVIMMGGGGGQSLVPNKYHAHAHLQYKLYSSSS